jgi:hypothetical protein
VHYFSVLDQATSKYSLSFTANVSDGLLVWENVGMTLQGDYFALAIQVSSFTRMLFKHML